MQKPSLVFRVALLIACSAYTIQLAAQKYENGRIVIRRTVNLVQLDVAVTDHHGNYVTGLNASNFAIYEDGIRQKIATFGEEDEMRRGKAPYATGPAQPLSMNDPGTRVTGHSVFILFDTSNYMYRSFVFAQDAIADFIRSLDRTDRVAFYSYSRDMSRDSTLTSDRTAVLRGVRATVAGASAALYDSLLWVLRDAAQFSGRRVVVVFSNGPDTASVVAPEDVLQLAQSEGIPIYMISTNRAKIDPVSTIIFNRMSAGTGGKAYFARSWKDQEKAFSSIRDDLAHLYSFSYYPQSNPNHGWRKITVKLVGTHLKNYRIRTRTGYRPSS